MPGKKKTQSYPIRFLVSLLTLLMVASAPIRPAQAELVIRYVDQMASGTGSGTSWANAYNHLQDALDEANANPGGSYRIWVANGVYYPDLGAGHTEGDPSETFTIARNNIQIYGGFEGGESSITERDWMSNLTILSGDIDGNDTNVDGNFIAEDWGDIIGSNSHHVVTFDGVTYAALTSYTRLDGFVITAGNAVAGPTSGAGIVCDGDGAGADCSPTFKNLLIIGNNALGPGGGAVLKAKNGGYSDPTFTNVSFLGNKGGGGGGLYLNAYAGGSSAPILVNCSFIDNNATLNGGGVYAVSNDSYTDVFLNNVEFISNQSDAHGGAITGAGGNGGSLYFEIRNSSFYGNQAINGGGVYQDTWAAGGSSLVAHNTILWGNSAAGAGDQFYTDGTAAAPYITYSDVQGCGGSGPSWDWGVGTDGGGNIDQDPLFKNPTGHNLGLLSASPAIDSGNLATLYPDMTDMDEDGNTAEGAPFDRAGDTRVVNGALDMGAFEYNASWDNVGFYVPGSYRWYLKTGTADGWAGVISFGWGGVSELMPVVGDWDGDGVDTAAFYKPSQWRWYLKNDQNDGWVGTSTFQWGGNAEMIPIAGDWDGDGDDTVGFYKPADSEWYLKYENTGGWSGFTKVIWGGAAGNIPIVGDWDGDGDDTIGFYVPSQNKWWLKNDLADGWTGVTGVNFGSTDPMDPVAGDWDGDGVSTMGGYVPTKWSWFLKDDQVDGWSNVTRIRFGVTADYEVLSGDWQ